MKGHTHSLTLTYSPTHLFTSSLTHSLTHSHQPSFILFTHLLAHSLIRFLHCLPGIRWPFPGFWLSSSICFGSIWFVFRFCFCFFGRGSLQVHPLFFLLRFVCYCFVASSPGNFSRRCPDVLCVYLCAWFVVPSCYKLLWTFHVFWLTYNKHWVVTLVVGGSTYTSFNYLSSNGRNRRWWML